MKEVNLKTQKLIRYTVLFLAIGIYSSVLIYNVIGCIKGIQGNPANTLIDLLIPLLIMTVGHLILGIWKIPGTHYLIH